MNKRSFLLTLPTALVFAAAAHAQTAQTPTTYTRPRVVAQQTPSPTPAPQARPQPAANAGPATSATAGQQQPQRGTTPAPAPAPSPQPQGTAAPAKVVTPAATTPAATSTVVAPAPFVPAVPLQPVRPLAPAKFRSSLTEAQRVLRSRLTLTAATSTPSLTFVTLAALDQESSRIHTLTVPKDTFLRRGAEVTLTTPQGLHVRLQILRPNYVNTAVVVSEAATGRQLTPLVVEYPIEKGGRFREMAYYTSAHPALVSPELVKHGQSYVRTMLDLAAKRLKEKGKIVSPQLIDIAERLCVVEHVDHMRFKTEDRKRLYEEVYALFALNELDTYRYSVSSAGAGGMVQMIPSTYRMVRNMHPSAGLNPDFVAGMRNHGNALEAMLLYMQDTWNGLALNQEVLDIMARNEATQPELVAAGYNSNPARLPLYIRRGGPSWRTLIPRETQMYLQIYKSVESLIEFKHKSDDNKQAQAAPPAQ
jgi:hypothetical protein